jgi:hypothetical protein
VRFKENQDCAESFSVVFFFLGRALPWVPRQTLPFLERRSPFPIRFPPWKIHWLLLRVSISQAGRRVQ